MPETPEKPRSVKCMPSYLLGMTQLNGAGENDPASHAAAILTVAEALRRNLLPPSDPELFALLERSFGVETAAWLALRDRVDRGAVENAIDLLRLGKSNRIRIIVSVLPEQGSR